LRIAIPYKYGSLDAPITHRLCVMGIDVTVRDFDWTLPISSTRR